MQTDGVSVQKTLSSLPNIRIHRNAVVLSVFQVNMGNIDKIRGSWPCKTLVKATEKRLQARACPDTYGGVKVSAGGYPGRQ